MQVCSFDWNIFSSMLSAIATIIGAFIALWIFFQWRKQKGSEVIANEAKDTIKDIIEACKILNDINNKQKQIYQIENEEYIKYNINLFKDINKKIITSSLFLHSSIIDNDLYNYIIQYDKAYKGIIILIESRMKFYGVKGKSTEKEGVYEDYIMSTKPITDILLKYALYKKTFKL